MSARRSLPAVFIVLALAVAFVWLRGGEHGTSTDAPLANPSGEREPSDGASRSRSEGEPTPLVAPAPLLVEASRSAERAIPEVRADGKVLVIGSVRDPDGHPITGEAVRVELTRTDGERTVAWASVDGQGRFQFEPLDPGDYTLRAEAPYHAGATRDVELFASEPIATFDLVLVPWRSVLVRARTPQGEPLAPLLMSSASFDYSFRLRVTASRVAPDFGPGGALRSGDELVGEYTGIGAPSSAWNSEREPPDAIGRLRFTERPRFLNLVLQGAVIDSRAIGPTTDEIVFTLSIDDLSNQTAGLRLRVVDERSRDPLARASVVISDASSSNSGSTDARGVFERRGLGGAVASIQLEAEGHAGWKGLAQLGSGALTDLGEIALKAEVVVRGRVVDENGGGHAHRLRFLPADASSTALEKLVATRADGSFEIAGLSAERFVVRSEPEGFDRYGDESRDATGNWANGCLTPRVVDLSAWSGELELELVPTGTLELRFTGNDELDSSLAIVGELTLATTSGLPIGTTRIAPARRFLTVPRGALRLTWSRPGLEPRSFEVVVGDQPTTADLR